MDSFCDLSDLHFKFYYGDEMMKKVRKLLKKVKRRKLKMESSLDEITINGKKYVAKDSSAQTVIKNGIYPLTTSKY